MAPYLSNAEIKSLSKNLSSAVAESRSQVSAGPPLLGPKETMKHCTHALVEFVLQDARKILEQLQKGVEPVEDVIRVRIVCAAWTLCPLPRSETYTSPRLFMCRPPRSDKR
jgi:hypothetical protein